MGVFWEIQEGIIGKILSIIGSSLACRNALDACNCKVT